MPSEIETDDLGQPLVNCDTCGGLFSFSELVETIEEYLCEWCASGIEPEDIDDLEYD